MRRGHELGPALEPEPRRLPATVPGLRALHAELGPQHDVHPLPLERALHRDAGRLPGQGDRPDSERLDGLRRAAAGRAHQGAEEAEERRAPSPPPPPRSLSASHNLPTLGRVWRLNTTPLDT